jgi:hypothetical protein
MMTGLSGGGVGMNPQRQNNVGLRDMGTQPHQGVGI